MKQIAIAAMALSLLVGCERTSNKPNIELVQNMMESPAIKAQDFDPKAEDYRANLVPPEGTVPRGYSPYKFTDPDTAGRMLKNPLVGRDDLMVKGQKAYFIYCQVCHGSTGKGDGPVADKLQLAPPSLVSSRVRDTFQDGYLYHLVVMGRGLMGGYGYQIPFEEDRWALVNYIRHLQKTQPVFPEK